MLIIMRLVSENKLQSLIAKALRTDLNKSVELSMKAVRSPIKFQGWLPPLAFTYCLRYEMDRSRALPYGQHV